MKIKTPIAKLSEKEKYIGLRSKKSTKNGSRKNSRRR